MKTINYKDFTGRAEEKHLSTELINNPEKYLNGVFSYKTHSQLHNVQKSGTIKIMGWEYDFRPFLKKFWYMQYGQIYQAFAPNKTALRKATFGRIDKIVEVI